MWVKTDTEPVSADLSISFEYFSLSPCTVFLSSHTLATHLHVISFSPSCCSSATSRNSYTSVIISPPHSSLYQPINCRPPLSLTFHPTHFIIEIPLYLAPSVYSELYPISCHLLPSLYTLATSIQSPGLFLCLAKYLLSPYHHPLHLPFQLHTDYYHPSFYYASSRVSLHKKKPTLALFFTLQPKATSPYNVVLFNWQGS